MDGDGHALFIDGQERDLRSPFHLADSVWVGAGTTILKGVSIGPGAIVAAGAVLTPDVAPRTLVAGVPAHVVSTDAAWQR